MDRALLVKTLVIGALALALLVPVNMIRDLVAERQARRNEAVAGIAAGWGKRQTLTGVYLLVPYERTRTQVTRETVDGNVKERSTERSEALVLRLPADSVEWSVEATTSEKQRGIHKARLYLAQREEQQRAAEQRVVLGLQEQATSTGTGWRAARTVRGSSPRRSPKPSGAAARRTPREARAC